MNHVHNNDPAIGPVCSHMVTDAMMVAWGLTTKRTDKVVGTPVVTRPGLPWREAHYIAWGRGFERICTIDPREVVRRPWVRPSVEHIAEVMAFPRTRSAWRAAS